LQAKLLEAVQLHSIKDITGKEFTLVSGNNEDPNYYHAFYNVYNEVSEKPAVVDNKKDLAKVDSNTTVSKTDMKKVEPLGIVLPEIVITAKSEERDIKPAGLEIIPKNQKITENATDVDRYAIEKGLLKTARDTGVLFKDQEALEQKFGVEPPKALVKEETVPAANTANTQSMLFNTADNPLSFLSGESTAPVENKTITTQEITPATTQENAVVDRYAIEKGLLKTARDTGVLFKNQEALEQKFGVEPPKALVKEETVPAANTANTQSMLFNTADNPLSFLSGESTAPVDNKATIATQAPVSSETSVDRYAIEKGLLKTARDTGVLFKDQEALEQKFGVEPPKAVVKEEPVPPAATNNTQSMLWNKNDDPLSFINNNSGSSIAIDNGSQKTIPISSGVIKTDKTSTLDNNKLPVVKTPLTNSTNIGTDAVFLKSDFQTDAVQTSSVTGNSGYQNKADESAKGSTNTTSAATDRYAIEKGLLKTARDTGVLFKDQEALEQKFGVEPPKEVVLKESVPVLDDAANINQSMLLNKEDDPLSFLKDGPSLTVENTVNAVKPEKTTPAKDRYAIEKGLLKTARDTGVPFKDQEALEQKFGVEPLKGIDNKEALPVLDNAPGKIPTILLNKETTPLFMNEKTDINKFENEVLEKRSVEAIAIPVALSIEKIKALDNQSEMIAAPLMSKNIVLGPEININQEEVVNRNPGDSFSKKAALLSKGANEVVVTPLEIRQHFYGKDTEDVISRSPGIDNGNSNDKFVVKVADLDKKTAAITYYDGGINSPSGTREVRLNKELLREGMTQNEIMQVIGHEVMHLEHGDYLFGQVTKGRSPEAIQLARNYYKEQSQGKNPEWPKNDEAMQIIGDFGSKYEDNTWAFNNVVQASLVGKQDKNPAVNMSNNLERYRKELVKSWENSPKRAVSSEEAANNVSYITNYLLSNTELVSWGMEAMRSYGSKPRNYAEFKNMIQSFSLDAWYNDGKTYGNAARNLIRGIDIIEEEMKWANPKTQNKINPEWQKAAVQLKENILQKLYENSQNFSYQQNPVVNGNNNVNPLVPSTINMQFSNQV